MPLILRSPVGILMFVVCLFLIVFLLSNTLPRQMDLKANLQHTQSTEILNVEEKDDPLPGKGNRRHYDVTVKFNVDGKDYTCKRPIEPYEMTQIKNRNNVAIVHYQGDDPTNCKLEEDKPRVGLILTIVAGLILIIVTGGPLRFIQKD